MFFNLKYHIASLVAVFLALALGILIGAAVPGGDTLERRQRDLAGSLEAQLETLRQRNHSLQERLARAEADNNTRIQFESRVLPVLVSGKLTGRRIAVIATSSGRYPEDLVDLLQMAGARVQTVTVLGDIETADKKRLIQKIGWPEMDDKSLSVRISREIASAVLSGDCGVLNILASEKVVTTGGLYGSPVDDVIIAGGGIKKDPSKIETVDLPVIDTMRGRNVNVYGVEESTAAFSYMKEYQKKGIATVDNIDTVPGQVSLVYSISGAPGHYGIKSTARELIPAMGREVPSAD